MYVDSAMVMLPISCSFANAQLSSFPVLVERFNLSLQFVPTLPKEQDVTTVAQVGCQAEYISKGR